MNAVKFKNFTNEDFSWKYNGVEYYFRAGEEIFLEEDKAQHFAKHLIDREMNKLGLVTSNKVKRQELEAQCFPIVPVTAIEIAPEEKAVLKAEKAEEEFADLKPAKKKKK